VKMSETSRVSRLVKYMAEKFCGSGHGPARVGAARCGLPPWGMCCRAGYMDNTVDSSRMYACVKLRASMLLAGPPIETFARQ
jgi:hypothetical protein